MSVWMEAGTESDRMVDMCIQEASLLLESWLG